MAIAGVFGQGLPAATESIDKSGKSFERGLAEVGSDHDGKVVKLDQGYGRALKASLKKIRAAGDLDGVTAVLAELERLKQEGGVPESRSAVGEIADLQEVYSKELVKLEIGKAGRIVALAERYDTALDQLERKHVSANKLEMALEVRKERRKVGSNPEVVAARALIGPAGEGGKIPPPTPLDSSDSGLCEVEIVPTRPLAVEELSQGAKRLSGGFRPKFSHVGEELAGAMFTVSPWQSKHEIEVRVTGAGALIVIGGFGNRDEVGGNQERVGDMLRSEHLDAPTRLLVKPGDRFVLKGHELGVVAGKIVVK